MGSKLGSYLMAIRFYGRKMEELKEAWYGGPHVVGGGWKRGCDRKSRVLLKNIFESILFEELCFL